MTGTVLFDHSEINLEFNDKKVSKITLYLQIKRKTLPSNSYYKELKWKILEPEL